MSILTHPITYDVENEILILLSHYSLHGMKEGRKTIANLLKMMIIINYL